MADVSWNQFVKRWREVYGKGLTYGQAMVACSSVWSDQEQKNEFISKHILNEEAPAKVEKVVEEPGPEEVKVEHNRVAEIKATNIPKTNAKSVEYYRTKAKYYKLKAAVK